MKICFRHPHIFVSLFLLLVMSMTVRASDIVFLYPDQKSILESRPLYRVGITSGVVLSPEEALSLPATVWVGTLDGELYLASINKLDRDAGLAALKFGEKISDELRPVSLSKTHKATAVKIKPGLLVSGQMKGAAFNLTVPQGVTVTSDSGMPVPVVVESNSAFTFMINHKPIGIDPIEINAKFQKAQCTLQVIRSSESSVWNFGLELTAEPSMSFWKHDKPNSLVDVPRPTFIYNYQAAFQPLKKGKSVSIPIDLYYVKEEAYNWTIKMKAKGETQITQIPIRFKTK